MAGVENLGGEGAGRTGSIRTVVLASFIGTAIEWYDFFLYATAAALIFNKLFFPKFDPLSGTLAAFATFAAGYAARPIGGVVLGHYGDRIGRKAMLVLSLLIMGGATFLVGLLPTYAAIGVWAPILLVSLRLLQGVGIGGEWGGAVLMSVEHSSAGGRGFAGSWPQIGVPAGLLLSTLVFAAVQAWTPQQSFLTWGWRIPFLLSGVLILIGLFVRLSVLESPVFKKVKESRSEAALPIVDVVRAHRLRLLLGMGMRAAESVLFPVYTVFILTYGKAIGIKQSVLLAGVIISSLIGLVSIPAWAALSDRLGRRPVYMAGALFSLLFAFPFFWLVDTRSAIMIWLSIVLAVNVGHNLMYGPQAAYFAELFGTRVRYSGVSIVYQVAAVFAGGLAPLIATALLAANHGRPELIALYVVGVCAVSAIATYFAPETYKADVGKEPEQASGPAGERPIPAS